MRTTKRKKSVTLWTMGTHKQRLSFCIKKNIGTQIQGKKDLNYGG